MLYWTSHRAASGRASPLPSKSLWLSSIVILFSLLHPEYLCVVSSRSRRISCHYLPVCCELMFTPVCCINTTPTLSHKMRCSILDTGTHALPLAFIICGHSQTAKDWHWWLPEERSCAPACILLAALIMRRWAGSSHASERWLPACVGWQEFGCHLPFFPSERQHWKGIPINNSCLFN